jgi:hypothetical protein
MSVILGPHPTLEQMLAEARTARPTQRDPRYPIAACDTFLATLSRHLAAVEDVVYPLSRRKLDHGEQHIAEYVRLARALELAMRTVEGSFYGDAYAPTTPREPLWEDLRWLLGAHADSEEELLRQLQRVLSADEQHAMVEKFETAVQRAPTRPHPYSPHGKLSPWQHRFWSIADRAMDIMDNRIIPTKPWSRHGKADSLLTQYMSGSPTFREPTDEDQPEPST